MNQAHKGGSIDVVLTISMPENSFFFPNARYFTVKIWNIFNMQHMNVEYSIVCVIYRSIMSLFTIIFMTLLDYW